MSSALHSYVNKRVLVVEDQQFIRSVVVRILRQMNFSTVLEAADGSGALAIVDDNDLDVIICDIEMEPMDGLVFLGELRKRETGDRLRIPVIFLTNHSEKETVVKARQLGVSAFLVKPVTVAGLRDKLAVVMKPDMRAGGIR
jgi:two-component system, chemotaxis family, chemotaxis protein CheY